MFIILSLINSRSEQSSQTALAPPWPSPILLWRTPIQRCTSCGPSIFKANIPFAFFLQDLHSFTKILNVNGKVDSRTKCRILKNVTFILWNSIRSHSSQRPQISPTSISLESSLGNLHNHVKIFKFEWGMLISRIFSRLHVARDLRSGNRIQDICLLLPHTNTRFSSFGLIVLLIEASPKLYEGVSSTKWHLIAVWSVSTSRSCGTEAGSAGVSLTS